jgi:hypothetical protein
MNPIETDPSKQLLKKEASDFTAAVTGAAKALEKFPIEKNGLHFLRKPDGQFVCRELVELRKHFNDTCSDAVISETIAARSKCFRQLKEVDPSASDEVRAEKGQESFLRFVNALDLGTMDRFDRFLYLLGHWWYYRPDIRAQISSTDKTVDTISALLHQHLVPCLPERVRVEVAALTAVNCAVSGRHFALLFSDGERNLRRIITDSQLIELHEVYGYGYLDLSPSGKPFARCVTDGGGGRAFFDGSALMRHPSFMTCAPKVTFVRGGYKVNSTNCSIINGRLFPLIDEDDFVSKTTGFTYFLGVPEPTFGIKQALASFAMTEESAKKLKGLKAAGTVMLNGKTITALGAFAPSEVELLENGFARYGWAKFIPRPSVSL